MHKTNHYDETLFLNLKLDSESAQIKIAIGYESCTKLAQKVNTLGRKFLIITQNQISDLYLNYIKQQIDSIDGSTFKCLSFPSSFAIKDSKSILDIYGFLCQNEFSKDDTIIALGGGEISDIAGFVASTYLRGINLILIPTSLLSQVDAAIGGKNGYNFSGFKNLIGTIYQPFFTFIDFKLLESLPDKQFYNGMAEVVKYALLEKTISQNSEYKMGPRPFFEILEKLDDFNVKNASFHSIILNCVKLKLNVIAKDQFDNDFRNILNLGHTYGHALESLTSRNLQHGEAISLGMIFALKLAISKNAIDSNSVSRLTKLLQKFNLPVDNPNLNETEILNLASALRRDKKNRSSQIKFVMPKNNLGEVELIKIDLEEVERQAVRFSRL